MVKVNRINVSQVEGGYSDDSDKRPNGEMALYNDDDGGFDLVIHDGVNSTSLNKVLGKGKLYGHGANSSDGSGYDTIRLIPDIPAYHNGSHQYVIIDPTAPNHVHIRAGGPIDNSNSELIFGGENSYIKVGAGTDPPISISASSYDWSFDTSGNIVFPDSTSQNTAASGLISNAFNTSLVAGQGIDLAYDGVAQSLTINTNQVAAKSAESLITECYNDTGDTLTKMTVVYINGRNGNLPTIVKAQADGESGSSKTYGVVAEDILDNHSGTVVSFGALIDLDTNQFSAAEGSTLYLSPTVAGGITTAKPSAPNHLVSIGKIIRNHNNQGIIQVYIQNGLEIDELHNVSVSSVAHNDILVYNSGTSLWENNSEAIFSNTATISGALSINNIVHISQANYDLLGSYDSQTLYVIT